MKYVIYGAGGIGGVVGARLFQCGYDVTLIARGDHQRRIREKGLRFISPDQDVVLQVPVTDDLHKIVFDDSTVVLLCVKSQHTQDALAALEQAEGACDAHIVCLQNGVNNEREALRRFANTYATVVNLPASFITPGEVVTHAQGRGGILDTGCYPQGINAVAEQINADLEVAGFSAQPQARVMAFKYAKLLTNLFNVLQAALTDADHAANKQSLRTVHRLLRDEALACFAAAGIQCASAEEVRDRQKGVYQMVAVANHPRVAGSSWQSVQRGTGNIETAYLNGEICLLGRQFNVPVPVNQICLQLGAELIAGGSRTGLLSTAALMAKISGSE